jgi:hypothetical protein
MSTINAEASTHLRPPLAENDNGCVGGSETMTDFEHATSTLSHNGVSCVSTLKSSWRSILDNLSLWPWVGLLPPRGGRFGEPMSQSELEGRTQARRARIVAPQLICKPSLQPTNRSCSILLPPGRIPSYLGAVRLTSNPSMTCLPLVSRRRTERSLGTVCITRCW